jgi:hypothetical protein
MRRVKARHAGENRHPGSVSGFKLKKLWIPASAGMTKDLRPSIKNIAATRP